MTIYIALVLTQLCTREFRSMDAG